MLARSVVWPGEWEAASLQLFSRLARDAHWVLDVGAFTGFYSLVAVADSKRARVLSFEPNPQILPNLRRNIAVNGFSERIRVFEAAVAAKPGHASLTVPDDRTAASIVGRVQGREIDVEVTTLDIAAKGCRVDLMKLDVEGAEAEALHGAATVLGRDRPEIVIELLSEQAFGEVRKTLARFGYATVHHLGPDGAIEVRGFVNYPGHANYHFPRT